MYKTFRPCDLVLSPQSEKLPYGKVSEDVLLGVHWGQRKLLLSEIEFFTLFWNPEEIPKPLCVYAGAAPSDHTPLLSEMFPEVTFHLYDPAPFGIKETRKIKIFNEFFTDEVAAKYAGRNDVLFICDIRTADMQANNDAVTRKIRKMKKEGKPVSDKLIYKLYKEADVKTEQEIKRDMDAQMRWTQIINPEHALLKFRLPYCLDGEDELVEYLDGFVFWQAWAPKKSTETRLKPVRDEKGEYSTRSWSALDYEQKCFHQNVKVRPEVKYKNLFRKEGELDPPELLNDFDSTLEFFILREYFKKNGITKNLECYTKNLSRIISARLGKKTFLSETREKDKENLRKPFFDPLKPFMNRGKPNRVLTPQD